MSGGQQSPSKLGLSASQKTFKTSPLTKQHKLSNIMSDSMNSFMVKSSVIPPVPRQYDVDRLVYNKPKHKPNRRFFDQTKSECIQEKENDALTM